MYHYDSLYTVIHGTVYIYRSTWETSWCIHIIHQELPEMNESMDGAVGPAEAEELLREMA